MLKIGDFANIFNISIKTVRFYEEKELFKPYYIDKYSGYRYYDEKNIDEMSRILYLKNLGFSLEEIKNYDETHLKNKIMKYKDTIKKLVNNIDILEKFTPKDLSHEIFTNDKDVIGKWNLIGLANNTDDALNKNFDYNLHFNFNKLYLMENGMPYWVISWSRGYIYINGIKHPYTIDNNLMYVNILYPEDNSTYMVAVYEKENSHNYSIEEIRKKDKFNGYFKQDSKLIGFWKSVDFIKIGQQFNYKIKRSKEDLILERLTVNPEDNTLLIYIKNKECKISKYTKNYILNLAQSDTLSKYDHKKINGKEYIFVEWKSEDYVFGNKIYGYYVLEKIGGNIMEEMFEKKEKIYTILSDKKNGLSLGKDIYLPNDKRGNINTLVIAGSGSGKTASFCMPNIFNMLGNYVITDNFGEIFDRTHDFLENNGYIVKTINNDNISNNILYNPLNHITCDKDVDILTDILIGDEETDAFWRESSKCLLKAILFYVMEKEDKKDLLTCFKLLALPKEELLNKFEGFNEDSKISKYCSILKTFMEKTYSSVVSSLIIKLAFVINIISEDTHYDEKFDFKDLQNKDKKIALFLTCKENDKSAKKMINIFISQLLSQLTINDEHQKVFLMLDEITEFDKIYDLPRNISIGRARGLSFNLIVNNLTKLQKTYGDDFYTILNSMDTQLLLGTNLKNDLDYFSDISGLDSEFIKNDLGRDQLIICEKGLKPILSLKDYYFNHTEWTTK